MTRSMIVVGLAAALTAVLNMNNGIIFAVAMEGEPAIRQRTEHLDENSNNAVHEEPVIHQPNLEEEPLNDSSMIRADQQEASFGAATASVDSNDASENLEDADESIATAAAAAAAVDASERVADAKDAAKIRSSGNDALSSSSSLSMDDEEGIAQQRGGGGHVGSGDANDEKMTIDLQQPLHGLTVEQLRDLLHLLEEEERERVLMQNTPLSFVNDVDDDRSLLDVFGQVSKDFLTSRFIPPTDEACRWDWRSLRCEPSCECGFDAQWGDYHVGRACRQRHEAQQDPDCRPIDPRHYLRHHAPHAKRAISIVLHTYDLGMAQSRHVMTQATHGWHTWRAAQCARLWQHPDENLHGEEEQRCISRRDVPEHYHAWPHRILCNALHRPPLCSDNGDEEFDGPPFDGHNDALLHHGGGGAAAALPA